MQNAKKLRLKTSRLLKNWVPKNKAFQYDDELASMADWVKLSEPTRLVFGNRASYIALWATRNYQLHVLTEGADLSDLQTGMQGFVGSVLGKTALTRWGDPENPAIMLPNDFAFILAQTITVGWREEAELVARIGFKGLVEILHQGIGAKPVASFILELAKDWLGAEKVNLMTEWREENHPDLGAWQPLLDHWRTKDQDLFVRVMHECADYHVQQSHEAVEKGHDESPDYEYRGYEIEKPTYWLWPVELLAVLRLREWHGLPNPPMTHPLFSVSALGSLQPELPRNPNPILAAAEDKYRALYPQMMSMSDLPRLRAEQGSIILH